jgi:hypothetical protein
MVQETLEYKDAINLNGMEGKKLMNYKDFHQMHTHGQFAKWLLKPSFPL